MKALIFFLLTFVLWSTLGKTATETGEHPAASHGKENEEHESEGVNIAIAIMLFGSITFQMSMFYLVNHPDDDMRKYSWQTISSTISIFCSVLIFKGCDGIVDWCFLDSKGHAKVIADFAHFFFWLLLLQATLYFFSGAHLDESSKRGNGIHSFHGRAKGASVLLAHITGFASINAWSAIQQLPFFAASPLKALTVVVLAFSGLLAISQLTDFWREWEALRGDGTKDDHEALWDEEVEEAEDDVVGLTVSFLTIQALRFAISSHLPNQDGLLEEIPSHAQSLMLLVAALCSVVLVVALGPLRAQLAKQVKGTTKERCASAMHNIASMSFAWALLYVIRGEVTKLHVADLGEGVMADVIIALVVSALAFLLIFGLDKLADLDATGEDVDAAIVTVILSFGIMVGFSWEQCFDAGLETISEEVLAAGRVQHWGKFIMALVLIAIVLPAWRLYILPRAHHAQHSHEAGHDHASNESPALATGARARRRHQSRGSPERVPLLTGGP